MKAKREQWQYSPNAKVWAGKYRNSHNMPHWHYDCELLFVENGSLDIFCNQKGYRVSKGQAFFIDSEQVHYMHALSADTVVTMIIFDYDIIKPFTEKIALASPLLCGKYQMENVYSSLKRELSENKPFLASVTSSIISLFMADIFRSERTTAKVKPARVVERFKSLLNEIDEKYEFCDLETAASDMGVNPSYFSRLFHKLTGLTFSQYLNYVRCENAVRLLQTESDMPITEIASRCGFATIRNFNRIFKEFTGYTPKALPQDYIMKDSITSINENSINPTFAECVLLESTDA